MKRNLHFAQIVVLGLGQRRASASSLNADLLNIATV
jgi:hypothetical protein